GIIVIKKTLAVLAAAIVVIGIAAAPAQASTIYTCPDAHLCFYHWVNYNTAGGVYRPHVQDVYTQPDECLSLNQGQQFDTGGAPVYDQAGSRVVNTPFVAGTSGYIQFFDWVGCTPGGNYFTVDPAAGQSVQIYDLSHTP